MTDSSHKTLKELTFASGKSCALLPRRVPRALATICWFYQLKLNLNVNTFVAVQRAIEPATEERAAAVSRRWGDYKNGKHKPLASVVNLAEQRIPGAKAILQSQLWDTLRLEKSAVVVARTLQGATSKEGDALLQSMLGRLRSSNDYRWLHKRCRAMVAHRSLDGLAVLTICMRLARRAGAQHLTLTFYRYATDCLEIQGWWFYTHGVAQAIAEYYEKILLLACCDECKSSMFSSDRYLNSIGVSVLAS